MTWTAGLPTELHLTVGEVVRIPLQGAMGAGNTWSVTVDDDRHQAAAPGSRAGAGAVATARIAVTPPPPPPPPPPTPSSSEAAETLEIQALAPGRVHLRLRLGRSWEPEALAHHTLVAIVT